MSGLQDLSTPYCGPAPVPSGLWTAWNFDPLLLLALGTSLVLLRLTKRPGLFMAGWLALVVAFVSPLCALTTALFAARSLHHLVLICVAAPAFAMALPQRAVPASAALVLVAGALVLWHVPAVYSAAWNHASVYWLMQGALFFPSWAFWASLTSGSLTSGRLPVPRPPRHAAEIVSAAALIGALAGIMGLTGAVLTFTNRALYGEHLAGALSWGIEPLADQHLAGLIMWVPGFVPLALIAAAIARQAWRESVPA